MLESISQMGLNRKKSFFLLQILGICLGAKTGFGAFFIFEEDKV